MARHKVEISGVNTANIEVLSNEEMIELFKRVKEGDLLARERLVNGNLKLVLSILKNFSRRKENLDDLFQIGCVGLLKAVDNFDLSHEVKFSTYAVPMILGEVRRYIRDNNSIRVSRSIKDLAYKILGFKERYLLDKGVEPTIEEICMEVDADLYDVVLAIDSMKDPISMFEPIYNDGGDTIYLYDQLADNSSNAYDLEEKISVSNALNNLNERQKYIINQRFVIGKTQTELAEELGISQAQISRLEKSAIDNVKKMML